MALDVNQIAALLGAGGTDLGKTPDWRKTLKAILKNPSILSTLQASATAATQPLAQYSSDQNYVGEKDYSKLINTVKQRWEMQGTKYKDFIDAYSAKLAETGGGAGMTKFNNEFESNLNGVAQSYGLDAGELSDLKKMMDKESKSFLNEQGRIERENYKAYSALKAKQGTAGDYMKKVTGVSGLENVAVTPEQLLSQRTGAMQKKLEKTWGAEGAAKLLASYQPKIKKRLAKTNPLLATLPSAIKKTVLGG